MVSFLILLCACAQDKEPPKSDQDLREQVDSLERKVHELELRQAQTTSANPLTVLNPTLTAVGDFLWRLDDKDVFAASGDPVDDTMNLREAEIDLRAAIDPYADGVFILSVESESPGRFDAGVEEMYATVKKLPLPFWEEPPLGTKIKVGRFHTEFGRLSLIHTHDLPQSDRPLVIEEFLGEEGHVANGISTKSFLPSPGDTALELTLQALQGGGIEVAQDAGHPCWLGNLHLFLPVTDEHSVDVSLIGFYGVNDPEGHNQSRVGSVDVLYRWKPLRQGEYYSLLLGGQLFKAEHEAPIDTDADGVPDSVANTKPFGYTAWGQYQLSSRLYAGLRWDETDFLANDALHRKKIEPYFSWYLSEFFRLRATYEHLWSDDPVEDGRDTFLMELTVVFGAHPPEPFWVNK